MWVECNISNDRSIRKKQLKNISNNPSKNVLESFLEEISTSNDYAITENKPMTLMGDYNIEYIEYLDNKE